MSEKKGTFRKLSPEVWDVLVFAYRTAPEDHKLAAHAAGVSPAAAKKAWEDGYEKHQWAKIPIRKIVQDEQHLARVVLEAEVQRELKAKIERWHERQQEKRDAEAKKREEAERIASETYVDLPLQAPERSAARLNAAKTMGQEALLLKAARNNLQGLLYSIQQLTIGISQATQKTRDRLMYDNLTPDQIFRYGKMLSEMMKNASHATETTMEMERRLLGNPQDIPQEGDMTSAEAMRTIDDVYALRKRIEQRKTKAEKPDEVQEATAEVIGYADGRDASGK